MAFQAKLSFWVSLLFDDGGAVMANEKSRRDVSLTKSIFTALEQQLCGKLQKCLQSKSQTSVC